jgi:predicted RecB family endonuclease
MLKFKWQGKEGKIVVGSKNRVIGKVTKIGTYINAKIYGDNTEIVAEIISNKGATKLREQLTDAWLIYTSQDVVVHSIMNGKPVTIQRSEVGTVCDPSTERYWTI